MEEFLTTLGPNRSLGVLQIFFSLTLSFILGMWISTVYRHTHQGFTYARSFVHTMVLATIIITVMIIAIGNNLARGLGILGAHGVHSFPDANSRSEGHHLPVRLPGDRHFLRLASLCRGVDWHPVFLFRRVLSHVVAICLGGASSRACCASCCLRTPSRNSKSKTSSRATVRAWS